jgi:hypothetical protein
MTTNKAEYMKEYRKFHRATLEIERTIRVLQQEDKVLLAGTILELQCLVNHLNYIKEMENHEL